MPKFGGTFAKFHILNLLSHNPTISYTTTQHTQPTPTIPKKMSCEPRVLTEVVEKKVVVEKEVVVKEVPTLFLVAVPIAFVL